MVVGAADQLCPLDIDVWEQKASKPPPFFSEDFHYLCNAFLQRNCGITSDHFTASNISDIYYCLVNYFST